MRTISVLTFLGKPPKPEKKELVMFYAFEYERQQYPFQGYVKKSLRYGGYKNKEYAIQALKKACDKHHTQGEVIEYGYPSHQVLIIK